VLSESQGSKIEKNWKTLRHRTLLFLPIFLLFPSLSYQEKKEILMSDAAAIGHGANSQTLFPPAELELLHASDREAARNIVCLLGGLFIVGILLYTFVCLWTG
jgi:hypothetical protein